MTLRIQLCENIVLAKNEMVEHTSRNRPYQIQLDLICFAEYNTKYNGM